MSQSEDVPVVALTFLFFAIVTILATDYTAIGAGIIAGSIWLAVAIENRA